MSLSVEATRFKAPGAMTENRERFAIGLQDVEQVAAALCAVFRARYMYICES